MAFWDAKERNKRKKNKLCEKYKIKSENLVNKYQTADPFALAKELDVNILYVPLPEKIRGILVRVLRKRLFY